MSKTSRPQRLMVIETFAPHQAHEIYSRLRRHGRLMPAGLRYVDSWVASSLDRCFQLIECRDESALAEWMGQWQDLVDFEIVPVMSSAEASERAGAALSEPGQQAP